MIYNTSPRAIGPREEVVINRIMYDSPPVKLNNTQLNDPSAITQCNN